MKFLDHFSRITTSGRVFLPQVDGLRFIAIMAVIAYHVMGFWAFHFGVSLEDGPVHNHPLIRLFESGHLGVNLFFVISGFILALPFAQQALQHGKPVRLRAYFYRRLTRLEPPYILNLAASFLLCAFVFRHFPSHPHLYHNPNWLAYAGPRLLASLFYSNGFIFGTHPYPNVVLWSLEVEIQFYILMPLFAQLFRIRPAWLRRAVFLALIALDALLAYLIPSYRVWASLLGNLSFFFVGLLICDLYLLDWARQPRRHLHADLLFILAGAAIPMMNRSPYLELVLPWLLLIFVAASFRSLVVIQVLSWPWIATIGGMCYTIYLYHFFMLSILIRLTGHVRTHLWWLDLLVQMALLSILIVALSAVLFVYLERTFMQRDWPERLWKTTKSLLKRRRRAG